MKNLATLSLVELDTQEMREVEGGIIPFAVIAAIWGVQAVLVAAGITALATVASSKK